MGANNWNSIRLGDHVEYFKGFAFKSQDYVQSGHPVIRVTNFTDRSIELFGCNYISPLEIEKYEDYQIHTGDVIIATVGSWPTNPESVVGKTVRVPQEVDGALLNQNTLCLRATEELDQRFLFYSLKDSTFQNYLIGGARGSANQASITIQSVFDYRFLCPYLPEQRAIAEILGALDDKIEVNRRMNATLESMAKAVFRQWFVEDEEVDDWEVGQVKDLGEVITGKTPPTNDRENYDGETPFITIPDMHGNMFVIETGKTLSEQGVQTQRNKTLPPLSICVSCIATPGLVSMTTKPSQTNQQINSLIPKDGKSAFYSFFALRELGDEIRARAGGGSVLLNLNKGQFETMPISIPPVDLLHKFQEFAEPLLMQLLANEKESRTLGSLRDSLLPKLMRGEVRVRA